MVRASDLRLNGREFDPRPPHGRLVLGRVGNLGIPLQYTEHVQPPRPTQPPTRCGTGNEYQPKSGDALRLEVKAGWLIPFVDKSVGGR